MPGTDPYGILGLSREATKDEIKKQYRTLAKKYHPDLCKELSRADAEHRFKAITEAYRSLLHENAPTPGPTPPSTSYGGSRGGRSTWGSSWGAGGQQTFRQGPGGPGATFNQDASLWSQFRALGRQEKLAFAGMGVICCVWLGFMYMDSERRVDQLYVETRMGLTATSRKKAQGEGSGDGGAK